jgi:hypothetical protein
VILGISYSPLVYLDLSGSQNLQCISNDGIDGKYGSLVELLLEDCPSFTSFTCGSTYSYITLSFGSLATLTTQSMLYFTSASTDNSIIQNSFGSLVTLTAPNMISFTSNSSSAIIYNSFGSLITLLAPSIVYFTSTHGFSTIEDSFGSLTTLTTPSMTFFTSSSAHYSNIQNSFGSLTTLTAPNMLYFTSTSTFTTIQNSFGSLTTLTAPSMLYVISDSLYSDIFDSFNSMINMSLTGGNLQHISNKIHFSFNSLQRLEIQGNLNMTKFAIVVFDSFKKLEFFNISGASSMTSFSAIDSSSDFLSDANYSFSSLLTMDMRGLISLVPLNLSYSGPARNQLISLNFTNSSLLVWDEFGLFSSSTSAPPTTTAVPPPTTAVPPPTTAVPPTTTAVPPTTPPPTAKTNTTGTVESPLSTQSNVTVPACKWSIANNQTICNSVSANTRRFEVLTIEQLNGTALALAFAQDLYTQFANVSGITIVINNVTTTAGGMAILYNFTIVSIVADNSTITEIIQDTLLNSSSWMVDSSQVLNASNVSITGPPNITYTVIVEPSTPAPSTPVPSTATPATDGSSWPNNTQLILVTVLPIVLGLALIGFLVYWFWYRKLPKFSGVPEIYKGESSPEQATAKITFRSISTPKVTNVPFGGKN